MADMRVFATERSDNRALFARHTDVSEAASLALARSSFEWASSRRDRSLATSIDFSLLQCKPEDVIVLLFFEDSRPSESVNFNKFVESLCRPSLVGTDDEGNVNFILFASGARGVATVDDSRNGGAVLLCEKYVLREKLLACSRTASARALMCMPVGLVACFGFVTT
jgi:hypothetical protein